MPVASPQGEAGVADLAEALTAVTMEAGTPVESEVEIVAARLVAQMGAAQRGAEA